VKEQTMVAWSEKTMLETTYGDQDSLFLVCWKFDNTLASGTFFRVVQWTKASNNTNIAFICRHQAR
jgi:hypothetical protein